MITPLVLAGYARALHILGEDYVSAVEIMRVRGITYTEDQIVDLDKKLPNNATLEAIRDAGMLLVAGPPTAMSMFDIQALYSNYFSLKGPEYSNDDWYNPSTRMFVCRDKIKALDWIALRKEPVEDSMNKTFPEQEALVRPPMFVPNIAETTWGIVNFKAVRGVCLFDDDLPVRTSSRISGSQYARVYVCQNRRGLFVNDGSIADRGPGIISAQKF